MLGTSNPGSWILSHGHWTSLNSLIHGIWYIMILVGGIPTPLKNDGVRQLGLWHSQYMEKKCSKPPTSYPIIDHCSYQTILGIDQLCQPLIIDLYPMIFQSFSISLKKHIIYLHRCPHIFPIVSLITIIFPQHMLYVIIIIFPIINCHHHLSYWWAYIFSLIIILYVPMCYHV